MADMHDDVKRRLEDAGRTLMMLPMPLHGMPAGDRAAWPEVMQRFWDVAGVADEGSVEERMEALAQVRNATTLRASREAVTRLDEVLEWLLMIELPHHRKARQNTSHQACRCRDHCRQCRHRRHHRRHSCHCRLLHPRHHRRRRRLSHRCRRRLHHRRRQPLGRTQCPRQDRKQPATHHRPF